MYYENPSGLFPAREKDKKALAKEIYFELFDVYKGRLKTKKVTNEAYHFSREKGRRLSMAAYALACGTWRVSGYFPFKTYHPERIINAPEYGDRIVEQWLVEKYLIPVFAPQIFKYNEACQRDKGPFKTMDFIREVLTEFYKLYGTDFHVFQYDCKKYFDNISHKKAFETFERYGVCGFPLYYYDVIMDSFHETVKDDECYAVRDDPDGLYGFPKGNLPSQWTGIMYLNELDWLIFSSRYSLANVRYMDDGLVFCKDVHDARRIYHASSDYLTDNDMGVRFHPKKTNIFPISRGFTYCGWHYILSDDGKVIIKIKNSKKKEEEEELKKIAEAVRSGRMNIEKAVQKREGIFNYLSHGDCDDLIDYMRYQYQFFDGEYRGRRIYIPAGSQKAAR